MQAPIETRPFTIPRLLFSRLCAEIYVRQFWWLLLPWILLGGALVMLASEPALKALGAVIAAWPLSIPARALFLTKRAAQFYRDSVRARIEGGWLYFIPASGTGFKISTERISAIRDLHGYLAISIGMMRFAIVGSSAFQTEEERSSFVAALKRPQ